MQVFLENEEHLTGQQKTEVARKTAEDVFAEFPLARDPEVAA